EIHAIMGPNGTGKSTLSSAIMGHPKYEVTEGSIIIDGEDVLEMEVDERAQAGLFLAMQYPSEISGVTNADFLRSAINARREEGDEISL
ncbi:ATP-binding cassette domain-containing protein, partial [Acinetobacter baumannii]|nr:ATP-binding cassette domain-containing protein [Acinetobacter baumannii]